MIAQVALFYDVATNLETGHTGRWPKEDKIRGSKNNLQDTPVGEGRPMAVIGATK